ncbi:hypothetical protein PQF04_gp43 [Streptococcus phage P7954]|uniref:Uncharacterized protein n=1 Tax=Streptococcus phage P7954 TaxID=1971439 RepID=A0A286QSF6_9CAUD|nr:hypothetical protein PQF04_gp43 [Streptococcus phage P7954]ARU14366.1 hypothetical protein P7954_43 [Streptococcus phage P7954]
MTTLSKRDNQLRFLTAVINVTTIIRVTNRPVVHKVLHVGKLYTIDCGAYGKFLDDNVQGYLRSY